MKNSPLLLALLIPATLQGQFALHFDDSAPLIRNGVNLPLRWAGGINFAQVSDIDLNADGNKDLFLFDKSGNKPITFLNSGIAGQASYAFTNAYDHLFPSRLREWVLLRDYNGDGKEDIFGYTLGGFGVWKNTSIGGNLSFALVDTLVRSNYIPTDANLYVTQVDIPGIEDIDSDGDLDVITFSIFGNYEEFHRNMSMELYGTADSLVFEVRNRCWGFFSENVNNNSVTLDVPCSGNVPDPQFPLEIGHATDLLRSQHHHPASDADGERAHVGSTTLPIDLDGDGDMDLLLGDVLFRNVLALYNGGNADSCYMTAQDSLFPVYDTPVDLHIFPGAYYEDVDNDGRRDLLVTPHYPGLSENARSVLRYKNNGTDAAPDFAFEQSDFLQEDMLDVGEGAYPVPFDFDGDGLMDLIVSNYGYFDPSGVWPCKMMVLRNTGTLTDPAFTIVEEDYEDLSTSGIGNSMYPAFGDVDGDGDKDMYIGDLQGRLHYYENIAIGPVADFELTDPTVEAIVNDTDTVVLDVGQFATPQLFDVDDDGLLDLLIGERNGNVNFYRNEGSGTVPEWHLQNDSIGGLDVSEWWNVTGYSVPHMYLNNFGQREMVIGSEAGWLHQYDGIVGNIDGIWNLVDSTWQDLREGERTSITLHDFDNDGYRDAIVGNFRGGLSFWRNDFAAAVIEQEGLANSEAFSLMPNPASDITVVELNIPIGRDARIELLGSVGQVLTSRRLERQRMDMDTRSLATGCYLVRVTNGPHRWTQRLVVVR